MEPKIPNISENDDRELPKFQEGINHVSRRYRITDTGNPGNDRLRRDNAQKEYINETLEKWPKDYSVTNVTLDGQLCDIHEIVDRMFEEISNYQDDNFRGINITELVNELTGVEQVSILRLFIFKLLKEDYKNINSNLNFGSLLNNFGKFGESTFIAARSFKDQQDFKDFAEWIYENHYGLVNLNTPFIKAGNVGSDVVGLMAILNSYYNFTIKFEKII